MHGSKYPRGSDLWYQRNTTVKQNLAPEAREET
jgi:hypothetical protein